MTNRMVRGLVGFAFGMVCYAIFLFVFMLFGKPLHQTNYVLLPLSSPLATRFQALWLTHRLELIAVVSGFLFPLVFSSVAWYTPGKERFMWLQRWCIQLALVGVALIATLCALELAYSILPFSFVLPIVE